MLEFGTLHTDEDVDAIGRIAQQTFNFSDARWPSWLDRVPRSRHRVIRRQGEICAGLGLYDAGQWFGGQVIPMSGVALVCVDPTVRGRGVANRLMTETLAELRRDGTPLAALFASTQQPYRRVGFEQAGSWCVQQHPLLPVAGAFKRLPVHRVDSLTPEAFAPLADRRGCRTEGNLDRSPALWQRLFDARENPTPMHGYLIGERSVPEGYIIYCQRSRADAKHANQIVVKDMIAETPAAAATIWDFFHAHRSMFESVVWPGPAVDPLLLAPTECSPTIVEFQRWMLRVIDVRAALEQRGYRCAAMTSLDLDVTDETLPENSGRYRLRIENGQARVDLGGEGHLQVDVRGLAALFAGFCSADALQVAGRLRGTERAIQVANQIFSGTAPWMPEIF